MVGTFAAERGGGLEFVRRCVNVLAGTRADVDLLWVLGNGPPRGCWPAVTEPPTDAGLGPGSCVPSCAILLPLEPLPKRHFIDFPRDRPTVRVLLRAASWVDRLGVTALR